MTRWQTETSDDYRRLEEEQRALAQEASSPVTRDIHLEFAERYRLKAEKLQVEEEQRTPGRLSAVAPAPTRSGAPGRAAR